MVLHVLWIVLAAIVFAKVEVQIEGEHGWAANLPTWRLEEHPLLDIFWGGRPLTGYHAWVFLFMALAFHLPMVVEQNFRIALEAKILGSLAWFWIIEDFFWFVINPAYGLKRFRKGQIAWHKKWLGPMPADYVTFLAVGAALLWYGHTH